LFVLVEEVSNDMLGESSHCLSGSLSDYEGLVLHPVNEEVGKWVDVISHEIKARVWLAKLAKDRGSGSPLVLVLRNSKPLKILLENWIHLLVWHGASIREEHLHCHGWWRCLILIVELWILACNLEALLDNLVNEVKSMLLDQNTRIFLGDELEEK
jgi:hypothetical protein